MCGIAGFTTTNNREENKVIIKKMVETIRHRGPDANSVYTTESIALGHARLSIIDLSEAGTQPMHTEGYHHSIVFNGEIYNYQNVKQELENKGISFVTQTDTEVALKLLADEGPEAISKLNGMFAIALWNSHTKTLDLFRDRIGKKPIYYAQVDDQFIFGSELKVLLAYPGIKKQIRKDALFDFFAYQYVPDPKTIFEGIYKLEPGTRLRLNSNGQITKTRYWKPEVTADSNISYTEAKESLLNLLQEATNDRLVSDVPLGAFLSGGVDSSGIVALMANQLSSVKTCSIGFNEKTFNETEFAEIVAKQYKTEHYVHTVHDNVASRLHEITSYLDEPFADPSLVPTFLVSELARQNVTVALTGDGGDEVFAGYSKYTTDWHETRLRNKFPSFARKGMGALAPYLRKLPNATIRRASSLMHSLSLDPAKAFYVTNSFLDDHVWYSCISDHYRNSLGDYHPSAITEAIYNEANAEDHLSKLLQTDMQTYLPGGILVKADRMSMANSLELRAPILDYRVIEFANRLPIEFKFQNGNKKRILKDIFEPWLPNDILHRKKMGFSTPLAVWFRTELKEITENTLFATNAGLKQFFKTDAIQALWNDHQSSRFDHSAFLWSLLMFELWYQNYFIGSEQ